MAERTGLSKSSIGRIWKTFELKPHRVEAFKLSNDPLFVEKVFDVVGLYLIRPRARLCCRWTRSHRSCATNAEGGVASGSGAVQEMEVGPPGSPCRGRLQTTASCVG